MSESEIKIQRCPRILERTEWSRSTLYLKVQKGEFPRPIKLGQRSVGWIKSEVDEWLESRIQQRDAEANRGMD